MGGGGDAVLTYPQRVLAAASDGGLAAYWQLGEANDPYPSSCADSSPNGFDATPDGEGSGLTFGASGGNGHGTMCEFAGTANIDGYSAGLSAFVGAPGSWNPGGDVVPGVTLLCWVDFGTLATESAFHIHTNASNYLYIGATATTVKAQATIGGDFYVVQETSPPTGLLALCARWRLSTKTLEFFINDFTTAVGSSTKSNAWSGALAQVWMGSFTAGGQLLTGKAHHFALYREWLTDAQLQDNQLDTGSFS